MNCKNCGAPRKPGLGKCSYCGSWFEHRENPETTIFLDTSLSSHAVLSPNDMRALLGLKSPSRIMKEA